MNEKRTTFLDHLEELRKRILYSVGGVAAGTIVGFFFAKRVMGLIIERAALGTTYFFAPAEAFIAQIKVAIFLGVAVSFPLILYQTWAFIGPGLTRSERKISLTYITTGFLLFAIGIAFGYFILIPYGLRFLLSFGSEMIQPLMNIGKYLNFFLWCLLGSGLLFQLPLLVFFLMRLGIVDVDTITRHRPEAIVAILIICAVITPTGDFFTLLLMSVPLLILFELSIIAAKISKKRKPS